MDKHKIWDSLPRNPRYLVTNLPRAEFNLKHLSDAYRLRWPIELLFKEWKSFANLKAFATSNPHLAEGLIWASLCAWNAQFVALQNRPMHAERCRIFAYLLMGIEAVPDFVFIHFPRRG